MYRDKLQQLSGFIVMSGPYTLGLILVSIQWLHLCLHEKKKKIDEFRKKKIIYFSLIQNENISSCRIVVFIHNISRKTFFFTLPM